MDALTKKESPEDQRSADNSLKKNLVVATVAAALGVSLGVCVGDVLAANERLSSPPNVSRQDKDMVSKQLKDANKVQQSTQLKIDQSKQLKFNTQAPQNTLGR